MTLILTPDLERAVHEHAAADYPGECCGVLIGDAVGSAHYVSQAIPLRNNHEDGSARRFRISPADLLQVEKMARIEKKSVIGFYHSHPDVPSIPSTYDREHAWEEYSYLIVQVDDGRVSAARSWKLDLEGGGFAEENVLVNPCILEASAESTTNKADE